MTITIKVDPNSKKTIGEFCIKDLQQYVNTPLDTTGNSKVPFVGNDLPSVLQQMTHYVQSWQNFEKNNSTATAG